MNDEEDNPDPETDEAHDNVGNGYEGVPSSHEGRVGQNHLRPDVVFPQPGDVVVTLHHHPVLVGGGQAGRELLVSVVDTAVQFPGTKRKLEKEIFFN